MKNLKITAPDGYEIDREKSTLEEIVFKPIEPVKEKYPMSVVEVEGRRWYINPKGDPSETQSCVNDINNLKSRELASAFLALMQLKTICDEWNRIDGAVFDWRDGVSKYVILFELGVATVLSNTYTSRPITFKDRATAKLFLDSFKEMIETAKPLL